MRDSNPQHPACKAGALTIELIALKKSSYIIQRARLPHARVRGGQARLPHARVRGGQARLPHARVRGGQVKLAL
jgi:hypothetical protein